MQKDLDAMPLHFNQELMALTGSFWEDTDNTNTRLGENVDGDNWAAM